MPKKQENASILIGTSDRSVAESMPGFLKESFGRESVVVKDSSDFLLEALDKSIDLTIIDVTLDGLPAEKTIRIFKKSRPRVPVIVLSDDYSVETGSSIMEHGIFYYVYKPVDYARLKDIVDNAFKKSEREAIKERR